MNERGYRLRERRCDDDRLSSVGLNALLFLRTIGAVLGASLHVVIVHSQSLIDLVAKSSFIFDTVNC